MKKLLTYLAVLLLAFLTASCSKDNNGKRYYSDPRVDKYGVRFLLNGEEIFGSYVVSTWFDYWYADESDDKTNDGIQFKLKNRYMIRLVNSEGYEYPTVNGLQLASFSLNLSYNEPLEVNTKYFYTNDNYSKEHYVMIKYRTAENTGVRTIYGRGWVQLDEFIVGKCTMRMELYFIHPLTHEKIDLTEGLLKEKYI